MHYEGLNIIRALNKHRRDTLLGLPDEVTEETFLSKAIAPFVKEQIDNLRSNLSKCALMLIKEVFEMSGKEERPDQRLRVFIRTVLPTALIKTVFEKNFIALEAKKACEQCGKNKGNILPESVDAFVEGSK